MSDLDLDALEAVAEAFPSVDAVFKFETTFDRATCKALIARVRRAEALLGESKRDSAYWRGRWCDFE